ncbi:ABC-type lipoprotein export system ATPase subunit [Catenuloplanes nepalensis]|uniref:ABC-type lipoprotein export system ATPase subunit n=1 Tax=Catenuloplanes nepalensis TaxID=587533 RepID=A0ABT9N1G1_9ACTN|nr:ATP-binding cassette domain-containing protein [Catenuloplanes nepalensis]MDP9797328.1 ABC-type lipoprotein export system ATPase subunit [Catenuloplanes nepalensis]
MNGIAVVCRRVVHIYRVEGNDVVALSGVDLDIAPGSTVALVGPSGSGKSTLIALLGGLMRPSAGRVQVGLVDLGKAADAELARMRGTDIGVVLQGAARNLLPHATLAANMWLAQRRAAKVRPADVEPFERILGLVGLGGFGEATVGELPPGAQQRAALAVGMAASPGLLLMDEPTSRLDRSARDEVLDALETVNRERGTTIVVVTHDPDVGARLGRAITIRDGRVGAEGRDGQEFAVVAGDGTVQLPPAMLESYPPGTLLAVESVDGQVVMATAAREPVGDGTP